MKTVEVLKAARKLIAEKGWTQLAQARDKNGKFVSMYSSEAQCFCISGAIYVSTPDLWGWNSGSGGILAFKRANGITSIPEWNDVRGRTKRQVLNAFDKAILAASSDGE